MTIVCFEKSQSSISIQIWIQKNATPVSKRTPKVKQLGKWHKFGRILFPEKPEEKQGKLSWTEEKLRKVENWKGKSDEPIIQLEKKGEMRQVLRYFLITWWKLRKGLTWENQEGFDFRRKLHSGRSRGGEDEILGFPAKSYRLPKTDQISYQNLIHPSSNNNVVLYRIRDVVVVFETVMNLIIDVHELRPGWIFRKSVPHDFLRKGQVLLRLGQF